MLDTIRLALHYFFTWRASGAVAGVYTGEQRVVGVGLECSCRRENRPAQKMFLFHLDLISHRTV